MKEKKKILSPYKRKVHIEEEEWTYQFVKPVNGERGYLKVCNPKRTKKYTIDIPVLGKSSSLENYEATPEEWDGEYEELYKVAITPKNVIELIKKNIISKEG